MAVLVAEMRNIDGGEWVGGLDFEQCARSKVRQTVLGLEDGIGAFQPAEIEPDDSVGRFYQIFQNGFSLGLSASVVTIGAAGCSSAWFLAATFSSLFAG